MKVNLTYSLNQKQLPVSYLQVMDCYGFAAKNIYNSALFIVNNIFSSYVWDKELQVYKLKESLHENQTEILKYINQAVIVCNNKQKDNFSDKIKKYNSELADYEKLSDSEKKLVKLPKEPKLKLFKEFGQEIDNKTYYQVIDKTLLETTIKVKEENSSYKDYSVIHSYVAQATVHKLCDNFSNYYEALKSYLNNKNSFTGKPQQPKYLNKTDRLTFELSSQRIKQGKVINVKSYHQLFTDYDKKNLLDKKLIEEFNDFNLEKVILEDCKKRNLPDNVKLATIRVVPGKFRKLPKIEYVVTYEKELKGFYPELEKHYALTNPENKKSFIELKPKQQLEVIKSYFKNNEVPFLASIDCGMTNFATVAYFAKDKCFNNVISGRDFHKRIQVIDNKLDKVKALLNTEEIKAIQGKKDRKEQLTREEMNKCKSYFKEMASNKDLVKLQTAKTNITNDFIHKLSKTILQDLEEKEIKVIVVGKNLGWKQESNMGRVNNRKFYNFPHARFIEILKYKAMLRDILVIETEESYTSKTSFIDNEELNVYKEGNDITQDEKYQLCGKRRGTVFITKHKRKIHADVNGAFNIIRKVFNFAYGKAKVRLSYYLNELKLYGKNKFKVFCGRVGYSNLNNVSFVTAL